jgi:hypothetical protein
MTMENTPDSDEQRRLVQRGRNRALALVLGGLVVLFYCITLAKIGG